MCAFCEGFPQNQTRHMLSEASRSYAILPGCFLCLLSGRGVSASHCPRHSCPTVMDRLLQGWLCSGMMSCLGCWEGWHCAAGPEERSFDSKCLFSEELLWAQPSCFGPAQEMKFPRPWRQVSNFQHSCQSKRFTVVDVFRAPALSHWLIVPFQNEECTARPLERLKIMLLFLKFYFNYSICLNLLLSFANVNEGQISAY